MIKLSDEIKKKYDTNFSNFENCLHELHLNSNLIRVKFLETKFAPIITKGDIKDTYAFIVQFLPFLEFLVFFRNDAEVTNKLRELGFANNVLKWMVRIDEIENEIKRLIEIDGLFILPYDYLFASVQIIKFKFNIELVEGFGLDIFYNNTESNTLFLDTSNRLRRRAYQRKNEKKSSLIDFDMKMNELLDYSEKAAIELGYKENEITKSNLQILKGNPKLYTDSFIFHSDGISKNNAYVELFPLLKLILKDVELLDETEFYSDVKETGYNDNYRFYKLSRVKKILLKK